MMHVIIKHGFASMENRHPWTDEVVAVAITEEQATAYIDREMETAKIFKGWDGRQYPWFEVKSVPVAATRCEEPNEDWASVGFPAVERWAAETPKGEVSIVVLTRQHVSGFYTHERQDTSGAPLETLTIGALPLAQARNFCQEHYGFKSWERLE